MVVNESSQLCFNCAFPSLLNCPSLTAIEDSGLEIKNIEWLDCSSNFYPLQHQFIEICEDLVDLTARRLCLQGWLLPLDELLFFSPPVPLRIWNCFFFQTCPHEVNFPKKESSHHEDLTACAMALLIAHLSNHTHHCTEILATEITLVTSEAQPASCRQSQLSYRRINYILLALEVSFNDFTA